MVLELPPTPICALKNLVFGMSFVLTWMSPPPHSPVYSGIKVLLMTNVSITLAGNKSNENVFLSGSVLESWIPLSIAWLYLSESPLTTIYFPSNKLTPETLFSTSPVFLSGLFLMASIPITWETTPIFFCSPIVEAMVSFLALDLSTTPSISLSFPFASIFVNKISRLVFSADFISTSLISFLLYPL